MKQRTITGLAILAVFIPLLLLGGIAFYLLMAVCIGAAALEIFRSTTKTKEGVVTKPGCKSWPILLKVALVACVLIVTFYPLLYNLIDNNKFEFPAGYSIYYPPIIIFAIIFILFLSAIITPRVELDDVMFVGLLLIFISFAGQAALVCREIGNNVNIFIYISAICIFTDSGAYMSGYFFGKHKLNPRISPKKTIEGAIGGTLVGTLIPFALTFIADINAKGALNSLEWYHILPMTFIFALNAQVGDLTFSAIKRHYGIKDYGKIFPGHGGILDRLDSFFYNLILFAIIYSMIYTGNIFIL